MSPSRTNFVKDHNSENFQFGFASGARDNLR
jgi:hypothetical protein